MGLVQGVLKYRPGRRQLTRDDRRQKIGAESVAKIDETIIHKPLFEEPYDLARFLTFVGPWVFRTGTGVLSGVELRGVPNSRGLIPCLNLGMVEVCKCMQNRWYN